MKEILISKVPAFVVINIPNYSIKLTKMNWTFYSKLTETVLFMYLKKNDKCFDQY